MAIQGERIRIPNGGGGASVRGGEKVRFCSLKLCGEKEEKLKPTPEQGIGEGTLWKVREVPGST